MALTKLLALPVALALSAFAPAAHAVVTTTPLQAAPGGALTSTGRNLSFKAFNAAFKLANGIPAGAVLTDVKLTTVGVTGGSISAQNFAPFTSNFNKTGDFKLVANGNTNGVPTSNVGAAVTAGVGATPGTGTSAISVRTNHYDWSIFAGGFDFTMPSMLALNVATDYVVSGWTPGGPFESADNSSFVLSNILANTYLSYDWTVPTTGVPAPLPLAGGITAFAFSRRLRRRISSTAS
jgi:hypothetical protein